MNYSVPLEEEIVYLENFIKLQQRLSAKVFVNFTYEGEVTNRYILPRILVTFVENAFKHGLSNDPLFPLKNHLEAENNRLHFTMENKINPNKKVMSSHTGAEKVRQVLETYYSGCHSLTTVKEEDWYRVELEIMN